MDLGAGLCLSGLALAHLGHLPGQPPAPPETAVQGACCYTWVGKWRQEQVKVWGTEDPRACEQGAQDGPEGHPHTDLPFSKCTPDTPTQYTHQALEPSHIGTHTSAPLLQLGLYLEPNSYNPGQQTGGQAERGVSGGASWNGTD